MRSFHGIFAKNYERKFVKFPHYATRCFSVEICNFAKIEQQKTFKYSQRDCNVPNTGSSIVGTMRVTASLEASTTFCNPPLWKSVGKFDVDVAAVFVVGDVCVGVDGREVEELVTASFSTPFTPFCGTELIVNPLNVGRKEAASDHDRRTVLEFFSIFRRARQL